MCIFFTFQQVIVTGDITLSSDEKADYYISIGVSHVSRQVCGDCDIYDPCQYSIRTPSVQENFKLFIMKKLWSLVLKTYIMTFQLLQDSPDHVQAYQASLMSRKTYFIELVYVYWSVSLINVVLRWCTQARVAASSVNLLFILELLYCT